VTTAVKAAIAIVSLPNTWTSFGENAPPPVSEQEGPFDIGGAIAGSRAPDTEARPDTETRTTH
jgi:hypothetical protein